MSYKCVIIDDERPARKLLESYCAKASSLEVVGSFKSALDALVIIKEQEIDIIFLDIQMPEITGLDFLKILEKDFEVIFTTAYREYALDGFEFNAVDYLLKPIAFPRFLKAINKVNVRQKQQKKMVTEQVITVKSGKKIYKISPSDILYIKSENEYIMYFTKNNGNLLAYGSLKNAIDELPDGFVRVHRSYIVNLKSISFVEGNSSANINDTYLPVSENYRSAFFKLWNSST